MKPSSKVSSRSPQSKGLPCVQTLATMPLPNGVFSNDTYDTLKQEFLDRLSEYGTFDGLRLVLHGSAATENLDDAEGDLLQAERNQVGPECPLVVTLDFHANISPVMAANADALIGYKTCPHIDQVSTGERAARLIISLIRRKIKPFMVLEKIPMLIPYSSTLNGPMKSLMDRTFHIEREEGIKSVSLFDSQAESEMRDLGRSVVVVGENESASRQKAAELRRMWWNL